MVLQIVAIHDYIVEIDDYKLIKEWMKDLVHQSAKCCWGISESERHHQKLEGPIASDACRLLFIPFGDAHLPIPRAKIEFREISGFTEPIKKIGNQRNWILVFDGYLVQCPVIDAHA